MELSDLGSHLALGFGVALTLENLFWCLVGAVIGTAVGVLPGLGPVATMALLLPVTYSLIGYIKHREPTYTALV